MIWTTAALGEVANIERSSVSPAQIESGSRYVGLEHIESGGGALSFGHVSKGDLASSKFQFGPDHILFGKLRPYLAKIVCPEFEGICSTDILPIAPGKRIDRRYLLHYLQRPETVSWASSRSTGVNLPRLSPKELASLEIPLPPLPEQRRIAAILDTANALRRKRKRAIELLDSLTQSIFLEMFGDPVSNVQGWPSATLGELGVQMTYGPRFYNESYSEDGIRIVRITDLADNGTLDFDAMPRLSMPTEAVAAHQSVVGEILFARTGATVGKMALVKVNDPPTIPGAYFIRMRFPDEKILPEFAWHSLRSPSIQKIIYEGSRQSAQQNFSGPGLRRLRISFPPLSSQQYFSQMIYKIDALRPESSLAWSRLSSLFASLQHRAFSGQL